MMAIFKCKMKKGIKMIKAKKNKKKVTMKKILPHLTLIPIKMKKKKKNKK